MKVNIIKSAEVKTVTKQIKTGPVPLRHSNFFMTVNTQQNINTISAEEYKSLQSKLESAVSDFANNAGDFIIFEHSSLADTYGIPKTDDRNELMKRIVGDPTFDYSCEVGPSSGRYHTHMLLCISKRGVNTKMDLPKIREFFNKRLELVVHFNCRVFNDAKHDIKNYIAKNPVN